MISGGVGAGPGPIGRLRRWTRRDDADHAPVLDLTDVDEVTMTLLAPPAPYQGLRRRVVDQFTIVSANRCRLARSVNWGPLDAILNEIVPVTGTGRVDTAGRLPPEVLVLLPVSTLSKRALVAFDLTGPGGSDAHLMPYGTSVAVQGNLIAGLADPLGAPLDETARRVVDAISRFRPGRLSGNYPRLAATRGRPLRLGAIRTYLEREADLAVTEERLRRWRGLVGDAERALAAALGEPFDPLSSAETLLLAVGELWRDPDVSDGLDPTAIEGYLTAFTSWIDALVGVGPDAVPVLSTVAEYGRRWEALAAVTVDPYRPFLIKSSEELRTILVRSVFARSTFGGSVPLWRQLLHPAAVIDVDSGGTASHHVSIGTDDTSIELDTPVMVDQFGDPVRRTYIEDIQRNREVYAFYTTDARRPARSRLIVGLSVSADVSRVTGAISVLMALTVGLTALPVSLAPDAVAVITLPSSFAATLLLTRERSSLAAWVLGPVKTVLLALLVALAVLAGLRAAGWHAPPDSAPASTVGRGCAVVPVPDRSGGGTLKAV
ncbi:conserved hypothetical protein [Frankia canadensis]|uniref:Uncharacterized protein n=2 Tax=Frankia canadensis TaxID=1836972 RepID=A0A2I2KTV1_9ACTN|nr:conserved hypothetical protein [Frankia canadensis]SOU56376.1 conserved hypothetical protein [Frankia canadensis]